VPTDCFKSRRAPELAKHDVEAKLILLRIGLTSISFINQKIERALTSYSGFKKILH